MKEAYETMIPKNPKAPASKLGGALEGKTLPGRKSVPAPKTLPSGDEPAVETEQSRSARPKKAPARKRAAAEKTLPSEDAGDEVEGQSTSIRLRKLPGRKRGPATKRSKETVEKPAGPAPKRRRGKKKAEAEAYTLAE